LLRHGKPTISRKLLQAAKPVLLLGLLHLQVLFMARHLCWQGWPDYVIGLCGWLHVNEADTE
jgi:hypothetical protein